MNPIIALLFSDSIILSLILPPPMKGAGLHSVTWLTAVLDGLDSGSRLTSLCIILAVEAGFFFFAKAAVVRFYLAIIRRMIRRGCEMPELTRKIEGFPLPETMKKRLKAEAVHVQARRKEKNWDNQPESDDDHRDLLHDVNEPC